MPIPLPLPKRLEHFVAHSRYPIQVQLDYQFYGGLEVRLFARKDGQSFYSTFICNSYELLASYNVGEAVRAQLDAAVIQLEHQMDCLPIWRATAGARRLMEQLLSSSV